MSNNEQSDKDQNNELYNEQMENEELNNSENEKVDEENVFERIAELEEKNQELNDRLLRRLAEFENYKKRTEQDQLNILKYAAEPFIIKVLSIYDDLERSLAHIDEENRQSLVDGLNMIHDKFTKILTEQGVEKLKTIGEQFDFNIHEALMRQPSDEVPSNTILNEIEPGYIYKDKIIKHAKVIVSEALTTEANGDETDNDSKE